MTDTILILSTCPTPDDAQRIARHLVQARLAACVNILPGLSSIYRWQGKIDEAGELLLIIKSRRHLAERLQQELLSVHPYDVPEFLVLPVEAASSAYAAWIDQEVAPPTLDS